MEYAVLFVAQKIIFETAEQQEHYSANSLTITRCLMVLFVDTKFLDDTHIYFYDWDYPNQQK